MQAHRDKGLCYNCDERFHPGHRCKPKFFLLMADPPETNEELPANPDDMLDQASQISTIPLPDAAKISLHALEGCRLPPQTLRVRGVIGSHQVQVLIDGGSTHNFVQDRVARFLGLPFSNTPDFNVLVGNGAEIPCSQVCKQVPLLLQSHPFDVDLFVLPLGGADVVLGIDWLKRLGPVLTDYETLSMKFIRDGKVVELRAEPLPTTSEISSHQLKRISNTESAAIFFHLRVIPPAPECSEPHPPTQPELATLLERFQHLFTSPTTLPPPRKVDHSIHLEPGAKPVNVKPYRYPYFQKQEIELQVKEMLRQGVIQPSTSAFSSPVLLVRKKDGSWRFCVDYRALNAITVKDRFPIPTIDELLDELVSARYFSKLDLRSGYHQIRMRLEDVHKTAFRAHDSHYEFRVMPFGLCNAPATFQAAMNGLFRPYLRQFVIIFFDDILIYSNSYAEHLTHLELAFQLLTDASFFLKKSKCIFGQTTVDYLGHIISAAGVAPDPAKVQAMMAWPIPKTVKELRGFLGLTGFYRKFIKGYATIASALTDLLKKENFNWSMEAMAAFDQLKSAMVQAPVLALPNFEQPFQLFSDASGTGMGAVLMQQDHPIAFFSKKFCPRLQKASTYVRELHAITSAVKKWRHYLLGRPFQIFTDQRSIKELMMQIIQTLEQQFYLAKLLGYDYTIHYKPGSQNIVADSLSRLPETRTDLSSLSLMLSAPHFEIIEEIRKQTASLDDMVQLHQAISQASGGLSDYSIRGGLIFQQERIVLSSQSQLKNALIQEHHSTPQGGHAGTAKTLSRIMAGFTWKGIREDVKHFVRQCEICQQTKYETKSPGGLLQPIPPPQRVWEDLSLDFIVGLPGYKGNSTVLVIVDRFSKAAHFTMLPKQHSAAHVAEVFAQTVCKLHGIPRSLISDRDPIFVSRFWKELFKLSGTQLRMSTAYHPQSDGQTEVVN